MIILVIYPKELEIKETTDAPKWPNYLDLHLEFDEDGKLFTRLYDKRDDFDFPIVNFLFSGSILISKLLKQGYSSRKLQTTYFVCTCMCVYIWEA